MDFIKLRRLWGLISMTLIIISVLSFAFNSVVRGKIMNFGIDFTGGSILSIRIGKTVETKDIENTRAVLAKYKLEEAAIQKSGQEDIAIRTVMIDNDIRKGIVEELTKTYPDLQLLEADIIGPLIGAELRQQAFWALVIATVLMTLYITFRFKFEYALAAIIALYHDAIITVGIFALLWRNVDSAFVAAILTILGYSINDTIVIFDRIRENLKKPGMGKRQFESVVNESIWQTLPRSINTVLTTLIMVWCLMLFGGATIFDFMLALFIGFSMGAYSSIFVASPLLVVWQKWQSR